MANGQRLGGKAPLDTVFVYGFLGDCDNSVYIVGSPCYSSVKQETDEQYAKNAAAATSDESIAGKIQK